jgi:hypothetical protein
MTTAGSHHEQEGMASPESSAPPEEPRGTIEAMRQQLEQHSALEDLGPLFGPEANGQEPLQKPPSRSQ